MKYTSIALAGYPKAGTSTLKDVLRKRLDLNSYYTGGEVRRKYSEWKKQDPKRKVVTFAEYYGSHFTDTDFREINDKAREFLSQGGYVVDSRFAALNCRGLQNTLLVFITAPLEIRAQRAFDNNLYGPDHTLKMIKFDLEDREAKEVARGEAIYRFDWTDENHYRSALILDSSKLTVGEEVEKVIRMMQKSV